MKFMENKAHLQVHNLKKKCLISRAKHEHTKHRLKRKCSHICFCFNSLTLGNFFIVDFYSKSFFVRIFFSGIPFECQTD